MNDVQPAFAGRGAGFLAAVDARDRALLVRCLDTFDGRIWVRRAWILLTHAGGATASLLAVSVPLFMHGVVAHAAREGLATLVLSHVLVQLVKRTVTRPRPSCRLSGANQTIEPDRFSFPSGHSAAAMSVAFAFGLALPNLAVPLVMFALLVGASRVFLGVHYPGDVVAGQLLAIATGVLVHAW